MFLRSIKNLFLVIALGAALAGCGGGGAGDDGSSSGGGAASSSIGAAGGTVAVAAGAQVVVPAGALATTTTIGVEQTSAGAPPLPSGVTAFGPMFAFTPHGTTFAKAVTITVPFDPALVPAGATPVLYKTNAAMTGWAEVPGATVNGSSMSGAVTGFSFSFVGPKLTPFVPHWDWVFAAFPGNGGPPVPLPKPDGQGTQDGGQLEKVVDFGKAFFDRPLQTITPELRRLEDGEANGLAAASEDGKQFGAFTEAPNGRLTSSNDIGSSAKLIQRQSFRKEADDASLTLTLTNAEIEATDFHGNADSDGNLPDSLRTHFLIGGLLHYKVKVYQDSRTFFETEAVAQMNGNGSIWKPDASSVGSTRKPLWSMEKFDFSTTPIILSLGSDACRGTGASLKLKAPLPITIDLSSVGIKKEFSVEITSEVQALNRRGGGDRLDCAIASASAFLRDPQQTSGTTMTFAGLEPTNRPLLPPPEQPLVAPTGCSAPNPAAGILQFEAPSFVTGEFAGAPAVVKVTRTGGSSGEVSVTFTTSDGTAISGTDYSPVNATVFFADGDASPRLVTVPTIQNQIVQPDKTVQLGLSDPGGCARLGTQSTALLTIVDDNDAPPVPTFTLGGTVTGLAGSGLVLRTNTFDQVQPTANGTFVFPVAIADGSAYSVSVATQPGNPIQSCTVSNGSGTIAGASVTNIAVDCVTPPPSGALDVGFGSQGIVSGVPTTAIARQADGKILAAGGMILARYNADGSLDAGFGSAGRVTLVGNGGALDALKAIAVQGDGKIVVAGNTSLPTARLGDDFVVFRLNVDGSLDPGFGSGGKVVTDFAGSTDRAVSVMVQADGKIVAAGQATQGTFVFAVARYLADGTPDAAFGSAGKATVNVTAGGDFANAAALQPDGKIVVVGRTFHERFGRSSGEPDIGVARFRADGTVDAGFGTNGVVRIDTTIGSVTAPDFDGGNWDDANDIVILADGTIAIGGYTIALGVERAALALVTSDGRLGGVVSSAPGDRVRALALQADGKIVAASSNRSDFALTRFLATGTLDTSFGNGGQLLIDIAGGTDVANDLLVQPDGKIVVVGSASNGTSRGSALVRVLP